MTNKDTKLAEEILEGLNGLVIFKDFKEDPVLASFKEFLEAISSYDNALASYSTFVSILYENGGDLGLYLERLLDLSETFYLKKESYRKDENMGKTLIHELTFLEDLSQIDPFYLVSLLKNQLKYTDFVAPFSNSSRDFKELFMEKLALIKSRGYGIYANHSMFRLRESAATKIEIVPVINPDSQSLSSLLGYKKERALIIDNTLSFLRESSAGNILLYGDAGTGKSSTVKALVNEYSKDGLRLVELKKHQLALLTSLMDQLSDNPLKFIIFIDDLSFRSEDENFASLKNILEGGASSQPRNVLIYATTNRRHMIKETMEDRQGTEIHENDSIQEAVGLANRFHLTITFHRPDRETYFEIVKSYALEYNLQMEEDQLKEASEAYALRAGGRSPRAAKQFVQIEKGRL